jgi:hypothetical protein
MSEASRSSRWLPWIVGTVLIACVAGPLGACGGASSSERMVTVQASRADSDVAWLAEQEERARTLDEVLSRPEVDCAAACDLGGRICDLAGRICRIAEQHPQDGELSGRCTDATARCESSRTRIEERCTCEPG